MYKKIIKFLQSLFYCSLFTLGIAIFLMLFGRHISDFAIKYTLNDTGLIFSIDNISKNKYVYDKLSYEDEFLKYTTQTIKPNIQTLENTTQQQPETVPVNLSALSGKYSNTNGTAVINNTKFDVTSLLNEKYQPPTLNKQDPFVLIYHTHTSESYDGGGTVVDVGKKMAEEFESLGYKTIHLTDVYDKEQFSGAYSRSIEGVTEVLKKYPSIKLVFDVHRDAITDASGNHYKPVTNIDGSSVAQVMFVCGTNQKGLSHPKWQENFKFALDVSRTLGKNYNGLSRPVNLRADRFNTHVTNYAFIIEVGSEKNKLEEALNASVYTARSIIQTIEKSE